MKVSIPTFHLRKLIISKIEVSCLCLCFIIDSTTNTRRSMSLILNILGFWTAQDSEYVSGFRRARVLVISGFWICQDSEYTRVLNIPGLHTLREKYPNTELFLVCIFLHLVWIWSFTLGHFLRSDKAQNMSE